MTKAGKRLIGAAREADAIANGDRSMTPEQRTQVEACKSRIKYARQGGIEEIIVRDNLIAEGFAVAAVDRALDELGERRGK